MHKDVYPTIGPKIPFNCANSPCIRPTVLGPSCKKSENHTHLTETWIYSQKFENICLHLVKLFCILNEMSLSFMFYNTSPFNANHQLGIGTNLKNFCLNELIQGGGMINVCYALFCTACSTKHHPLKSMEDNRRF